MRSAKVIHDQIDAMDALEALRAADVPMLFVHDEYGHFEGLVTPADLLAAIAGEFASDQDIGSEPFVVERLPTDVDGRERRDLPNQGGGRCDVLRHRHAHEHGVGSRVTTQIDHVVDRHVAGQQVDVPALAIELGGETVTRRFSAAQAPVVCPGLR